MTRRSSPRDEAAQEAAAAADRAARWFRKSARRGGNAPVRELYLALGDASSHVRELLRHVAPGAAGEARRRELKAARAMLEVVRHSSAYRSPDELADELARVLAEAASILRRPDAGAASIRVRGAPRAARRRRRLH